MSIYIFSYDLRRPEHNYHPLWEALKRFRAVRCLRSVWLMESSLDLEPMRDSLRQHMHDADGLILAELKDAIAGYRLDNNAGDFLTRHFGI